MVHRSVEVGALMVAEQLQHEVGRTGHETKDGMGQREHAMGREKGAGQQSQEVRYLLLRGGVV